MRPLLSLLLVCASLSLARAQQPAIKRDGYAPELVNLQTEYRKAMDAYYAPYERARSEEERVKVRLDASKDPGRVFAPRFLALAHRASGTDTAAQSLMMVLEIDRSDRPDSPAARAAGELVNRYADHPIMEQLADSLRYAMAGSDAQRARRILDQIVSRSRRKAARAAALLNLARLTLSDSTATNKQKETARGDLRRLRKDFADTSAGKAAEHELFEAENLQIGMTSPDFEATDEAGNRFKLSDYRGKVVVLDFWGFW